MALAICASVVFGAGALAEEAVRPGPTLSPGWTFAEQDGAAIYAGVCAACHQPDAQGAAGAGTYPALAANRRLASADTLLQILLRGLKGMPPVGAMMSDQQVADVANYVRSHFGNSYPGLVSVTEVKATRRP